MIDNMLRFLYTPDQIQRCWCCSGEMLCPGSGPGATLTCSKCDVSWVIPEVPRKPEPEIEKISGTCNECQQTFTISKYLIEPMGDYYCPSWNCWGTVIWQSK